MGNGLLLGVELAQQEALILANELDHLVNNKWPLVRFMDDSFVIVKTKEDGFKLLEEYKVLASKLGIQINVKKTRMIPLRESFVFCKWCYKVFSNGKVMRIPIKDTIYRQRRKLKKLYLEGRVLKEEVDIIKSCFNSYLGISNYLKYKSYWN